MILSRRTFLAGSAAAGLSTFAPQVSALASDLTAATSDLQLAPPEYPKTLLWTYNSLAPGPVIRARRGDRIKRRLVNSLPQDTTVHWHGIRIRHAMDGVPKFSQDPVQPGEDFLYDFVVPDAGTFWYHPHVQSWEQIARGLHGALIIDEDSPPEVDRDELLVLDDWRLDENAQLHDSFGAMHDWAHAGRIGNYITVNGDSDHRLAASQHERFRLRLINVANARVFTLKIKGMAGWLVALDGQPLRMLQPMDSIRLAPAQRADLIVDVTESPGGEAFLVSFERDTEYALTTLSVNGQSRRNAMPMPPPLEPNDLPQLAPLDSAVSAALVMEGGAMGNLRSALLRGVETEIRDLVTEGFVWSLNGMADRPAEPLLAAKLGQTARITIRNDTRWPHAMHLHGHHFRKVNPSGVHGPWRDTILLDPEEEAMIAFVADNPGAWLLHCHMLEHAASGMSTWIEVS